MDDEVVESSDRPGSEARDVEFVRPAEVPDAGIDADGRSPEPTPARATSLLIAGYLGKSDRFDRAIGDFSVAYADQNERDYDAFTTAIAQGRLPAYE